MADGRIEIAPVGYMRGRTLNKSFIVIDEAQNCTYPQLKMLLTRLGWHSTMVLTGDPGQSDLLDGMSGFADIAGKLAKVDGIAVVTLGEVDVVRHPLVARIVDAYDARGRVSEGTSAPKHRASSPRTARSLPTADEL